MESLKRKLDQLSPELRREVEDYVDYLVSRMGNPPHCDIPPHESRTVLQGVPPLMISGEPVHELLYAGSAPLLREQSPSTGVTGQEQVLHGLTPGGPDRDYLDYGTFEDRRMEPSSPATEAVQRVKAKLSTRVTSEQENQLLEWID